MAVDLCTPVIQALADAKCDSATRKQTEEAFNEQRKQNPKQVIGNLLEIMTKLADQDQVAEAEIPMVYSTCIVLKNSLPEVWHALNEDEKDQVAQRIITCFFKKSVPMKVRERLGYCLETILCNKKCDGSARDALRSAILPNVMKVVSEDPSDTVNLVMGFLNDSLDSDDFFEFCILPHEQLIQQLLSMDPSVIAGVDALKVREQKAVFFMKVVSFLEADKIPQDWRNNFVPNGVLKVLMECIANNSTEAVKSILNNMEEACAKNVFSACLQDTIKVCVQAAQADEDLRAVAIQTILALVEAEELDDLKNSTILIDVMKVAMNLCTQIDGDGIDEWVKESNEDDDTEDDVKIGCEALERLLTKTSPVSNSNEGDGEDNEEEESLLLKPLFAELENMDPSKSDWTKSVAKLLMIQYALTHVIESDLLQKLQTLGLQYTQDPNPRVRFAAWIMLNEFNCSKRQRAFAVKDEETRKQWLETITAGLEKEHTPRVLSKALDTLFYYIGDDEELEPEDLEPYMERLLTVLLNAVEQAHNQFMKRQKPTSIGNYVANNDMLTKEDKAALDLQVNGLGCVGAIIGVCKEIMGQYYDKLMPVFYKVLDSHRNSPDARELLGAAIECASTLGSVVPRERFINDSSVIAEAMCQVLKTADKADDPVKDYAFQAAKQLAETMKKDFIPYLQHFLPELFLRLGKTGFEMGNAAESMEDIAGSEVEVNLAVKVDPVTGAQKVVCIKTAYVEDICSALSVLQTFMKEFGEGFVPFMAETIKHLMPLLDFEYDENVKAETYEVYSEVVKLCVTVKDAQALDDMLMKFIGKILASWEASRNGGVRDFADTCAQATGLRGVISAAGSNCLSVERVGELGKVVLGEMEYALEKNAEESDESAMDFILGLCEVTGALMEHHPDHVRNTFFQQHVQAVNKLITTKDPENFRVGLWMTGDLLEYMGDDAVSQWQTLIPVLIKLVDTKKIPDEVQPASFALSLAARHPEFGNNPQWVKEIADRCVKYIQKVRSSKKENSDRMETACDNCLAALGQLLNAHANVLDEQTRQGYYRGWISCLPLRKDEEEALRIHALLVDQVASQNDLVLANLSEAVRVMTTIYRTAKSDDAINKKIGAIVSSCNPGMLEKCVAGFPEKLKKKVMRIYEDVKQAN